MRARLRFAPGVDEGTRSAITSGLPDLLIPSNRVLDHHHASWKTYHRVEIASTFYFVKGRAYSSIGRRVKRTLLGAKEDREFARHVALRDAGVPCSRPVAGGVLIRRGLAVRSVLVTEYLEGATLREYLRDADEKKRASAASRLAGLIDHLRRARVVHGDLQWNNIIVPGNEDALSVLDAARVEIDEGPAFEARFARTLDHFIDFCAEEPSLRVEALATVVRGD